MEDINKYNFPFGKPIGYTLYRSNKNKKKNVYFLHNFETNDDILGDRLPCGEDLAIQYCRVAMEGWTQSREFVLERIEEDLRVKYNNLAEKIDYLKYEPIVEDEEG